MHYSFSTSVKPNSNGVFRPNILTITFSLRFSAFTSSMRPLNPLNGPSLLSLFLLRYKGYSNPLRFPEVHLPYPEYDSLPIVSEEPGDPVLPKANNVRSISQMMSDLSNQSGFYQNVTRKISSLFYDFLTVTNLIRLFGRNQHLRHVVAKVTCLMSASRYSFTLFSFPLTARNTYHFFSISDMFSYCLLVRIDNIFHDKLEGRIH